MDNAIGVEILQAQQNGAGVGSDGGLSENAALLERAAGGVLHAEIVHQLPILAGHIPPSVFNHVSRLHGGENPLFPLEQFRPGELSRFHGEDFAGDEGGGNGDGGGGPTADGSSPSPVHGVVRFGCCEWETWEIIDYKSI